MGGTACPLYDPGNHRSIERGSDLQAARHDSLTTPAKPAGERETDAALTPRPGTRSYRGTHAVARRHDLIVCLPRLQDAPAVGEAQRELPLRENLSLVAAL